MCYVLSSSRYYQILRTSTFLQEGILLKQLIDKQASRMGKPASSVLTNAFVREVASGRIFLQVVVGVANAFFPVRHDRRIIKRAIKRGEVGGVEICHPHDLGIREVKWV
ncbi:MAG: hypothetical protein PHP25_03495 [Candidatus Moranbacteria bacterium]|nr:hypothetical protein [Candidatus Moranbacteria bacterium]